MIGQVSESQADAERRERYEAKTAALVGRHVMDVTYWDIHNYSDEPRTWDYGDWHHAVMGVELLTEGGSASVRWTQLFYDYGLEVFQEPMSHHLSSRADGPEGWIVGDHPEWRTRKRSPIRGTATFWEQIEKGAGHRVSDNVRVSEPRTDMVPVALRLDFDPGPVWMVAGMPMWPDVDRVFVPADEIMVVFTAERMIKIGFPRTDFLRTDAAR